jgi:hypothetical protein
METENQFQNGRELHKAERLINKLNAFFFRICPSLYSLAYCNNREYKILRGIVSFFIGTCYAITIWYLTIFRFVELSDSIKKLLLVFITMVISSGMVSNYKSRCIMTIAIFKFVFKFAKVVLISSIVVGILTGPFHNIYTNLSELGGSMMCQYKQLQNLTNMQNAEMKANKDLIKQALSGYKEMSAQKNDLSGLIDGLYTEMEGNTQSKTHAGPLLTSKDSISKENNYYQKNL